MMGLQDRLSFALKCYFMSSMCRQVYEAEEEVNLVVVS